MTPIEKSSPVEGPRKYRTKAIEVEAQQLTKAGALAGLTKKQRGPFGLWYGGHYHAERGEVFSAYVTVGEGVDKERAELGDWIIRDAAGNLSCCKADTFAALYEPSPVLDSPASPVTGEGDGPSADALAERDAWWKAERDRVEAEIDAHCQNAGVPYITPVTKRVERCAEWVVKLRTEAREANNRAEAAERERDRYWDELSRLRSSPASPRPQVPPLPEGHDWDMLRKHAEESRDPGSTSKRCREQAAACLALCDWKDAVLSSSSSPVPGSGEGEGGKESDNPRNRDMKTRLYVIEQANRPDAERVFWNCSTEHGCGWHPGNPMQAFSPSELAKELRRLIDQDWFCDVVVRELTVAESGKAASV